MSRKLRYCPRCGSTRFRGMISAVVDLEFDEDSGWELLDSLESLGPHVWSDRAANIQCLACKTDLKEIDLVSKEHWAEIKTVSEVEKKKW